VFSLSLRDVELLLAERGIVVSYETVRRWCQKFGESFAKRLRRRRPRPGDKWHLDEVFIRIQGVQTRSAVTEVEQSAMLQSRGKPRQSVAALSGAGATLRARMIASTTGTKKQSDLPEPVPVVTT
jgi:transposase-like protein